MMRKFVVEFLTECISTNLKIKSLTKKIKSQYSNLDLIHDTTFEAQRIWGVHNIFQSWMTKRLSPQNGIAFTSHGHENLPLDWKCLLAPAPHQSLLDTPSIMREISVPHISLAVDRFKNKPIFGYTYQSWTVMFDENDPKGDGMRAMNDLKNLVDQWVAPLIFPEGERNTTDKLLLPIKPWFAILALEKNLPIVPIAIIGTKDILPVWEKDMYPGHIHIEILPSIILTEEEKLDYDTQYNQLWVDPTPLQLTKIQIKFIRLLSQRYEEAMLNYLSK